MEDFEGLEGVDTEGLLEIERIFSALPVTLNLGDDKTIIGRAYAYKTKDDDYTTIILTIDPDGTKLLQNLSEVFELYALGFAGIKKEPKE